MSEDEGLMQFPSVHLERVNYDKNIYNSTYNLWDEQYFMKSSHQFEKLFFFACFVYAVLRMYSFAKMKKTFAVTITFL
jgi:hypothetical protein